ncbi:acyltransferase family protein [Mesobacillus foraminis]|uniref:Fucose 4-O-acetylase-like acetyltransferase n=1 Tax=Mesobacillus foraminis TaxID=279826 RepID=A0A4R2BNF2_9BACI|nr:acyltransferase family protein [Mesobacillus foraminis]TCN27729.1 fucose 4-O-acetylase-like acetyltransferase [Mesobacillus foraminis]
MKQRNYYFDNAKFILIFFVVFGHLLRTFIEDNEIIYTIYKVIYTFHMPAFILVSGFFARGFNEKGYIAKIAKKLILPYLIFQLIYSVYYFYLYDKSHLTVDPLNPHWSLWFLISLFFWNIMLIGFSRLSPGIGLSISLLLGLGVGYLDWVSNYLSLSRTFVFFPMFLLGYHLTKDHVKKVTKPGFRILALVSFLIVFVGFTLYPTIDYKWLLGSKPYSAMDSAAGTGMLIRLGLYGLSTIMVFSFLAFVPKGQYFFTKLGKHTLYVYLLHGFFVRTFRESDAASYFQDPETLLFLAGIALALTLVLSSGFITAIAQPIIELKLSRFIKVKYRTAALYKLFRKKMLSN